MQFVNTALSIITVEYNSHYSGYSGYQPTTNSHLSGLIVAEKAAVTPRSITTHLHYFYYVN